jgi:hypothetical protein
MKNFKLLLAMLVCVGFTACDDDDDDKSKEIKDNEISYRIVSSKCIEENSNDESKTMFYYTDDNKLESFVTYEKSEDGEFEFDTKHSISYDGEKATKVVANYEKETETWKTQETSNYKMKDGLILEEACSGMEGQYEFDWKYTYSYNSNKQLIDYKEIDKEGKEIGKSECIYKNNKLKTVINYMPENGELEIDTKREYTYHENGELKNFIEYNGNGKISSKCEFSYENSRMTKMETFNFNKQTEKYEEEKSDYAYFEYDTNGNLVKITTSEDVETFTYEKGKGNAQTFYYFPEDGLDLNPQVKSAKIGNNNIINSRLDIFPNIR